MKFKTKENLFESVSFVIRGNLDRLRYDKNVVPQLSSTF